MPDRNEENEGKASPESQARMDDLVPRWIKPPKSLEVQKKAKKNRLRDLLKRKKK